MDDYTASDEADLPDKHLKTDDSRRVIPLHELALSLGFARYVDGLRSIGQPMLFPDLRANMFDKLTQEASRRANRYIDAVVTDDPRVVFNRSGTTSRIEVAKPGSRSGFSINSAVTHLPASAAATGMAGASRVSS